MNLQENIDRIKSVMGIISEQKDAISTYVSDPNLKAILEDIQNEFGEKFTDNHFKLEKQLSGDIKVEAGGLLPDAIEAFNKMKNESGCNDIFIKEVDSKDPTLNVSYRSYDDQKNRFINEGKLGPQGQRIDFAMKRVSIPGYSQHHTGLAIDYGGNTICLRKNAWPNGDFNNVNKWGFTLPYMSGNVRMIEPWHLYFKSSPTNTNNPPIVVSSSDIVSLADDIKTATANQSIDESSIKLDMAKKQFSVNSGNTKVVGLRLRFNAPGEKNCPSCINTITKNAEFNPKTIKEIIWDNNRIAQIIAFYPKK